MDNDISEDKDIPTENYFEIDSYNKLKEMMKTHPFYFNNNDLIFYINENIKNNVQFIHVFIFNHINYIRIIVQLPSNDIYKTHNKIFIIKKNIKIDDNKIDVNI